MKQIWTEEMVVALCRGHAAGRSAGEIAKDIGTVSRNAVIGKARRLGLSTRVTRSDRPRKPKPKANRTTPDLPQAVLLFDLEPHHCRYPVDGEGAETLFCAADTYLHHSYCLKHCEIAFNSFHARAEEAA